MIRLTAENKKFPWYTTLFSVLLIVLYFSMAYLSKSLTISEEIIEQFGAVQAIDIYHGNYAGVIVNNLIHINFYHLLVNLVGIWLFGAFLERRIGWWRMAIFGFVCSVFTSLVQLALSNDPGLGIAGANFGFFSLLFIVSLKNDDFKFSFFIIISAIMILLLISLVLINLFLEPYFAIESKIAGILWGFFIGLSMRWKSVIIQFSFLLIPFGIAAVSLVYSPWSSEWLCAKGIQFHKKNDTSTALLYYQRAVRVNSKNELAKENIRIIRVENLSKLAYKAHLAGEYLTAHRYYLQILALGKNNKWAIENLKRLP